MTSLGNTVEAYLAYQVPGVEASIYVPQHHNFFIYMFTSLTNGLLG